MGGYDYCPSQGFVVVRVYGEAFAYSNYKCDDSRKSSMRDINRFVFSFNPKSLFWSLNSLLKGARSLYNQRLALIWQFSDYKNIITKLHLA